MNIGKKYPIGQFKGDGFVKCFEDTIPSLDSYTKLMIHGDGIKDSTGKTVTAVGGAAVTTTQYKFNKIGRSIYLDGNGDWLTVADSDDWNFGSGDFTIDFWFRHSSLSSNGHQFYFGQNGGDTPGPHEVQCAFNESTGQIRFYIYNQGVDTAGCETVGITINVDTWYHLAIVRNGSSSWTIYLNGTSVATDTRNITIPNYTSSFHIGNRADESTLEFIGYITEFRISKGIARWTSNFTPPTDIYGGTRSVTVVTGLNGDVDEEYKMNMFLSHCPEGNNAILVCPNNDTASNYRYQRFYATGASPGADSGTATGLYSLAYAGTTTSSRGEMTLIAKTGHPRTAKTSINMLVNSTTVTYVQNGSTLWTDTSSNITSLVFLTQSGYTMDVGTYLSVWKKIKST